MTTGIEIGKVKDFISLIKELFKEPTEMLLSISITMSSLIIFFFAGILPGVLAKHVGDNILTICMFDGFSFFLSLTQYVKTKQKENKKKQDKIVHEIGEKEKNEQIIMKMNNDMMLFFNEMTDRQKTILLEFESDSTVKKFRPDENVRFLLKKNIIKEYQIINNEYAFYVLNSILKNTLNDLLSGYCNDYVRNITPEGKKFLMFFADETEHGKPFIHPYIPLPVYKAFMSELLLRNILMDKKIDRDTSIVRVNKHAVSAIETYIFGKKMVRTEITLNKKNIEEPILFGGPGATGGGGSGSIKRKIKP